MRGGGGSGGGGDGAGGGGAGSSSSGGSSSSSGGSRTQQWAHTAGVAAEITPDVLRRQESQQEQGWLTQNYGRGCSVQVVDCGTESARAVENNAVFTSVCGVRNASAASLSSRRSNRNKGAGSKKKRKGGALHCRRGCCCTGDRSV
eukprot:COSAG01_NODE_17018_length_1184_cov_6.541014_2_plen_146_part_00